MDRVELLIERVRVETENKDFGDSFGISDNECVGYLNDAQDRVYSEAMKKYPKIFMQETTMSLVVNQEAYDLPSDIYLGKITLIEFSSTGQPRDYVRLDSAMMQERISYPVGNPRFYIRKNKQILLVPTPANSGTLRISYIKKLPKLDIRRAKVLSVTQTLSDVTAITLDVNETLDVTELNKRMKFSVVSSEGESVCKNISFSNIDTSTGLVTMTTRSLATGESISAGDYIVAGEYSTNKSELEDITERYLVSHLRLEMLDRDGNTTGTASQNSKAGEMLSEIIDAFADMGDDNIFPPILDGSYLTNDEWM
jgi:hypothetical protein